MLFWDIYRSVEGAGASRHHWVPLTPDIADLIGVAKQAPSPDAAAQEWHEAGFADAGAVQFTQNAAREYVPSEEGYPVRLLDGKRSVSSVTNPLQTALRQSGEHPTATLPFLRNVPFIQQWPD